MKPIIGMLTEVDKDVITKINNNYVGAIEGAGGLPVVLPYTAERETLESFAALCDGFCFTGGNDIDPARYGEEMKPTCGGLQPLRDELEFAFFEIALRTKKPILAICRGAQVVNVALGGTLYQDLPSEKPSEIAHRQTEGAFAPSHEVALLPNTPLTELVGKARMSANSFHHQAIKTLGAGVSVMALADDGIIEAVCAPNEPYLRAYQWHPERLWRTDEDNRRIFDDFVSACRGA